MKHKSLILIVSCMTLVLISNKATALDVGNIGIIDSGEWGTVLSCTKTTCPSNTMALEILNQQTGTCANYGSAECYTNGTKTYLYYPCQYCVSPYTMTDVALQSQCGQTKQFKSCECICSNCNSESWANYGTGYQRYISRTCDCGGSSAICQTSYYYSCAAGYWGTSSNGTSGCSPCPPASDIYTNSARTTKAQGTSTDDATDITDCYIAPGTYYDTTGTFTLSKLSNKCSYKE